MKRRFPYVTSGLVGLALFAATCGRAGGADTVPAAEVQQKSAPAAVSTGSGRPKVVRVGVKVVDLGELDENEQTFEATVDVRYSWNQKGAEPLDVRGDAVDEALAALGAPEFDLANLADDPAYRERGLIVEPGGHVELLERTKGVFTTQLDEADFPFDHQELGVEVVVRGDDLDHVNLEFHGDDVAFSEVAPGVSMVGWDVSIVDLAARPMIGWHDRAYSRVIANVHVRRQWFAVVPTIFVPLFSSLLIPMIAIWLQKVSEDDDFEVDAFELANIVIGGLFAVIALNFTVNSEFSTLASGDNTVSRLFALNYSALAAAMVVDIALFQFGLVERWFGKHVQAELYRYLSWAIPVASLGAAAAFLLVAWA